MNSGTYTYHPEAGHGLRGDPLNSIVGPRPIGWISSLGPDGIANLAPYSFFNAFNYTPPLIGFASIGWKDTVANISASGEFCWNLATRSLASAMNASSAPAPADIDEFALAGLTQAPSLRIRSPRVLESPVNFECRLSQLVQFTDADGVLLDTWLVMGEVVTVHIDHRLISEGRFDSAAAQAILRGGGGGDYLEVNGSAMFEMRRDVTP